MFKQQHKSFRGTIGSPEGLYKNLLEYLQKNGIFTPELLNRFDEVVTFRPLNEDEISEVTRLVINDFAGKLAVQDIVLSVTPQAVTKISHDGYNQEFGARPLRRFVQDKLEDNVAKKLLSGEIARGDKILVSVDGESNLIIEKQT